MSRRALALGAGAVAAGLIVLGPAGVALAGPPSVTISSPQSGGVVSSANGFVVQGAVTVSTSGGTIGSLQVTITSPAGHPGYTTSLSSGWCGASSCTYAVKVPALAWNGGYTAAVSTSETDPQLSASPGTHPVTVTTSFSQAVPPAAPRSFSASPASDGKSVSLYWTANTEPDLVGYEISRSPASPGSWPAATTGTSFVDSTVQPGVTYSYQIEAVRSGASSNSTVNSSPSGASATTPAPPPPPTTASGSGSGSSSGSSAGSGSTSGASSGSSASGSSSGSGSSGGTYFRSQPSGSAPSAQPEAAASLSAFQALLSKTRANTSAPALAAPSLPAIPEDGVGQPGADNPTVAPFSSGAAGSQGGARSALATYDSGGGGPSRFQSTAAVALAALLVAIAAHLIWLRRQIGRPPTA